MTDDLTPTIIPADSHSNCLLCGTGNPFSQQLQFRPNSGGGIRCCVQAHAGLQGYDGILHGGVISAWLDSAMTHCLFAEGIQAVTGDLRVRFLKSVPCTAQLELWANIEDTMPPLYRLRAELRLNGTVMAWANATFMERNGNSC